MSGPAKKKTYNIGELSVRHQNLIADHNRMAIHVTHLTNAVNAMSEELHALVELLEASGVIKMVDEPVTQPLDEGAEGLTSVPAEIPVEEQS